MIFPAYAGLNLLHLDIRVQISDIPRIRGVEPEKLEEYEPLGEYSPHTRGWTSGKWSDINSNKIFPAYAGLNLTIWELIILILDIPRIRGVEPTNYLFLHSTYEYSPHTRGWTWGERETHEREKIFPAYAGLNLYRKNKLKNRLNIPRIRGVEPEPVAIENDADKYSPHTRGWTYAFIAVVYTFNIFPAYAGLNLMQDCGVMCFLDIPRIRGVEPVNLTTILDVKKYSPHTRGWTRLTYLIGYTLHIFPAYAGLNLLLNVHIV